MRCAFCMLRTKRPAPTSATSARAISVTTSRLRKGFRVHPTVLPRPPVLRTSVRLGLAAFSAGATPMSSAVSNATLSVNSKTCESNPRSTSLSATNGGRNDHNTERPPYAIAKPANAEFFFAAGGLREQQVGEIDAGNQENESDDTHHESAGKGKLAAIVGADGGLGERRERDAPSGIIGGEGALEAGGNRLQRRFRRGHGDSVFQAAVDDGRQKTARVEIVLEEAGEHLRVHADGNPNFLGGEKGEGAFEAVRGDADDGVRCGVEGDGLTDNIGIGAEFVGPQTVAEHGDIVSAGFGIFVRKEESSDGRPQAQKVKIAGADHLSLQLARFGTAAPGQGERA